MLPKEYERLRCQCIDIPHDVAPSAHTLEQLIRECDATALGTIQESIVAFRLPQAGAEWRLRDSTGRDIPMQVRGDEAVFIVRQLSASAKAS